MSTAELKKDVEIVNQSFGKSHFSDHLKGVTKSGHFSLGVTMFSAPSPERWKEKKQVKAIKDTRRELQTLFKENRKKIMLSDTLFVLSIPEQLAKVIDRSCRPPGFNHKLNTGGELYSIVNVSRGDKTGRFTGLRDALRLLDVISEPGFLFRSTAHITFSDNKIRQVVPVDFIQPAAANPQTSHRLLSLADLKELEVTYKNYGALDKQSKEDLETGFHYLERIRSETDAHITLSLLAAAIEFYVQGSEKEPQWYFSNICKELAVKTGYPLSENRMFENFYAKRTMLVRERKKTGPDRTSRKNSLLVEMEHFYRLLLKKMATDPVFLKQTLPGLKTSLKKELKKITVKKKWRKFPGRHLARLFDEH